ncbi:MAG: site-specific integrase [Gallionella sp.]|nr:site-specific integrase [Gallionella sp.]
MITVSPRTLLKKFSDLNHFFSYLKKVAKATLENPLSDLEEMTEAWRAKAKSSNVHYMPFNDGDLRKIFSPVDLLVNIRDPDYFWAPLLGMHLGVRLGEVVNRQLRDIGYMAEIDVWYIDVPTEGAKNVNSVRRLPITAPLIELGFLRYVEHVRKLGGKYLFPHRNWSKPTAMRDPSKNQSRNFGMHMTAIGLPASMLVFHSFRHTIVSALQDAGVPLSHAMQIAGHEAQDHAIKTGRITTEQARSVHLSTYTHADLARLGIQYPILELTSALERSVKPPIDYQMLARAGDLVRELLRNVGGKFVAGWPPQSEKYTQKIINRLRGA